MTDTLSTTIDLIRHGEPVGGSRYRGQTDDPLSERGWEQMRTAVGDAHPWDVVLTSPLSRCRAFAAELSARHGLPLETDARLMELGFGAWEGRTAAELLRTDPDILARFWRDPLNNPPPGGERLADFRTRLLAAWGDLLARHTGRHVLVVCHAGTIRLLVSHVLDMPLERLFRLHVPNAGISRIRIDHLDPDPLPHLMFHAGSL
jgi:alpha-ribazole phosphatase/probable phosphoglycerate mutase